MNKSFALHGRERQIDELRALYALRKHVVIAGPAGIGKTALLRQIRQCCPVLVCDDTSSLRPICDSLERQLGWSHHKLDVIECKNRLLGYLQRRAETVVFDHVERTAPRIARFIERLAERIPIWVVCRADHPHEIGHIWPELYKFIRIEIPPLTLLETRAIVEQAVARRNIQADALAHVDELHRVCGGRPRILEELLIELGTRRYKIDGAFGLNLLDLDRRIHEINLSIKATAEAKK